MLSEIFAFMFYVIAFVKKKKIKVMFRLFFFKFYSYNVYSF